MPFFDPFRPYGNRFIYPDVVEILGDYDENNDIYTLFDERIDMDNDDWLNDEIKSKIDELHKELPKVLEKIIMAL